MGIQRNGQWHKKFWNCGSAGVMRVKESPPTPADIAELGMRIPSLDRDLSMLKGPQSIEKDEGDRVQQLISAIGKQVPRVGVFALRPGDDSFQQVQQVFPQFELRPVILRRGAQRFRVPPKTEVVGNMPLRKTLIVHRKTGPSIISTGQTGDSQSDVDMVSVKGWPPRATPQHGPAFLKLDPNQKEELKRLHHNLGHPDPARLKRMLEEQGASEDIGAGALDMQCDACLETQKKPRLSNPGSIHDNDHLDFNEVVGADGTHWKSRHGTTYHFTRFIDESTHFHLGALKGGSVPEQIATFENVWLQRAGPRKPCIWLLVNMSVRGGTIIYRGINRTFSSQNGSRRQWLADWLVRSSRYHCQGHG